MKTNETAVEKSARKVKRSRDVSTKLSLIDAAAKVLKEKRGKSMSCNEMVEEVVSRKLWMPGGGKTPASTLASSILREIRTKEFSRFKRVSAGQFAHT